jgi:hypothetical protein
MVRLPVGTFVAGPSVAGLVVGLPVELAFEESGVGDPGGGDASWVTPQPVGVCAPVVVPRPPAISASRRVMGAGSPRVMGVRTPLSDVGSVCLSRCVLVSET